MAFAQRTLAQRTLAQRAFTERAFAQRTLAGGGFTQRGFTQRASARRSCRAAGGGPGGRIAQLAMAAAENPGAASGPVASDRSVMDGCAMTAGTGRAG